MGSPLAWLLNFESDEELAIGGTFTPSAVLAGHLKRLREAHAERLLRPGDRELGPGCEGLQAEAWCPTPTALDRIRAAGAIAPPAPSFEVLRRVNSRAFCSSLARAGGQGFFARDETELHGGLAAADGVDRRGWLLKRNYGTSGRGQLRLSAESWTEQEASWIACSWRAGGLRVEPFRQLDAEFSIHGWITAQGQVSLGEPCWMQTDAAGSWLSTRLARPEEARAAEVAALRASAQSCAQAMLEAGYFGPFGIDAYRWLDAAGNRHFESRSEINARYTLGWKVGFGDAQPSKA